jgi:hypothetical protein
MTQLRVFRARIVGDQTYQLAVARIVANLGRALPKLEVLALDTKYRTPLFSKIVIHGFGPLCRLTGLKTISLRVTE